MSYIISCYGLELGHLYSTEYFAEKFVYMQVSFLKSVDVSLLIMSVQVTKLIEVPFQNFHSVLSGIEV